MIYPEVVSSSLTGRIYFCCLFVLSVTAESKVKFLLDVEAFDLNSDAPLLKIYLVAYVVVITGLNCF
jgi:hypothetical protein